MTEDEVREVLAIPNSEDKAYIANINSSRQIIVSEGDAIDELKGFLKANRKLAKPLSYGAFHTRLWNRQGLIYETLEGDLLRVPEISLSNVTGEKYDGTSMVHVLSEQIVSPVLLYSTLKIW